MRKKEEKIPSFDDLKNPNYTYYYSRSERIARRRQKDYFEIPDRKRVKGILGYLSGGNPQVRTFIGFYIFIAFIFWIFTYMNNPARPWEKKTIKITNNRFVKVNLVKDKELKGLNIILENNSKESWIVTNLSIQEKAFTIKTNLNLKIERNNFEALFFETGDRINIRKIKIKVNE